MNYTTPLLSGGTSHESDPPNILTKVLWRFYTLVNYIYETLRYIDDAIQDVIHLGLASATNALEARITERLLRDVGCASAPSECPEGNIKLHELCKVCTSFTQRSVALSWLDSSNPQSDWPPRVRYRLCTVAHLRRLNGSCHFCTILYYFVSRLRLPERDENADKNWLYLRIWPHHKPWEHGSVRLFASLYRRKPQMARRSSDWREMFDLCLLADHGAGECVDMLARANHIPLRSNDNTECMREWLESCLKGHAICRAIRDEPIALRTRPERMLALAGGRVKLICNWPETSDYKYLALSHMWGTDSRQQLRLVLSRLDEFQKDIPWTELPFIFKEAIRIARQVGYNYIWIDSLCIIQDSASDWANEAGKMAHVYGHADCTIAYLLPPQDVLTKPRQDPRVWTPCILRRPSVALRGVYICAHMGEDTYWGTGSYRTRFGIDWLSPKDWPLFTRAWACQEYLLSPRIVFVGHRNLMWECSESLFDELLGPIKRFPGSIASKTHFLAVRSVTLPVTTMAVQLGFMENWGRLIRHYRTSVLTQPKDRIMAFAGIAKAVHDSSKMTYLAGSWAQMFPLSFTWSISDWPVMTEVEPVVEAVPSWSWFSVPIDKHATLGFEIVDRIKKMLHPLPMYQATLLSFGDESQQAYADPSSTKAFHAFTKMNLNLAMKTWTGFLRNSKKSKKSKFRCERSIEDQFRTLFWDNVNLEVKCQFDHQVSERDRYKKVMTFGLLIELRTEPSWTGLDEPFLIGLILQPEPSGEAYKRIGLWSLHLNGYPTGWDAEKLNSVSIFDQLPDVRSEHIRLV